jgi:hypothetical protein
LLTHDVDAGGLPRPEDIPDFQAEQMVLNSVPRLGNNFLFMCNVRYPCDDLEMRKALIRLCDKDALDELLLPMSVQMQDWLPASMPK